MNRPPTNPFSASRVRPGTIDYRFGDEEGDDAALDRLLERWCACGRQGALVGPHGAGKSTLLHSLRRRLAERGERTLLLRPALRRRNSPYVRRILVAPRPRILLVDGWEMLPRRLRRTLLRPPTVGGFGVIATTHRPCRAPVLARVEPTVDAALRVAQALAPNCRGLPERAEIEQLFARRGGNLRELLFDLYDHWESTQFSAGDTECLFTQGDRSADLPEASAVAHSDAARAS